MSEEQKEVTGVISTPGGSTGADLSATGGTETILTGEQALAEGRGKIELPPAEQPVPAATEPEQIAPATEATLELSGADAKAFAEALVNPPEPAQPLIDAVAEHVKGSQTIAEIAEQVASFPSLSPDDVLDVVEVPTTNALGTHDFCPMGAKCNHFSRQHCEQAKLEADHRRDCGKGHLCDCFSPYRGIPSVFRGGR